MKEQSTGRRSTLRKLYTIQFIMSQRNLENHSEDDDEYYYVVGIFVMYDNMLFGIYFQTKV